VGEKKRARQEGGREEASIEGGPPIFCSLHSSYEVDKWLVRCKRSLVSTGTTPKSKHSGDKIHTHQRLLWQSIAMSNGTKGQAGINGFHTRKNLCLSKRDRSSAGRIDPKAVEICAAINAREEYYTTSSCAGRCFLYCGDGFKAHHHFVSNDNEETENSKTVPEEKQQSSGHGFFHRFRVSHDVIRNANRYFDFSTLDPEDKERFDPSGGGDPVRTVAQYDYKEQLENQHEAVDENPSQGPFTVIQQNNPELFKTIPNQPTWLRYEPFILHVMCRSLSAAHALMNSARLVNKYFTTSPIASPLQIYKH